MTILIPVQVKRKTAAAWTAADPVLLAGEPGFESDTGKLKIGDGATPWTGLSYIGGAGGTGSLTGAVDPNGSVSGVLGQLYTEVPGDGSATVWTCLGGTVWV